MFLSLGGSRTRAANVGNIDNGVWVLRNEPNFRPPGLLAAGRVDANLPDVWRRSSCNGVHRTEPQGCEPLGRPAPGNPATIGP